jgi:hypothetical protein
MEDEEAALSSCAAARVEAGQPARKGGGHLPRRGSARLVGISTGAASRSPNSSKHPGGQASRSPAGRWGTAAWRGPPKSASTAPLWCGARPRRAERGAPSPVSPRRVSVPWSWRPRRRVLGGGARRRVKQGAAAAGAPTAPEDRVAGPRTDSPASASSPPPRRGVDDGGGDSPSLSPSCPRRGTTVDVRAPRHVGVAHALGGRWI